MGLLDSSLSFDGINTDIYGLHRNLKNLKGISVLVLRQAHSEARSEAKL